LPFLIEDHRPVEKLNGVNPRVIKPELGRDVEG
jgi:hypothetical protein